MNVIDFPPEARAIKMDYDGPRWTQVWDVQALLWLARQTTGSILEIGCNEGRTTRELAIAFPDRNVIGVDSSEPEAKQAMDPAQRHEQPAKGRVGICTDGLSNVLIMDRPAHDVYTCIPKAWPAVDFVFIDGDHSYNGVREDSWEALDYLIWKKRGIVAWHDCYEGSPNWVGVQKFLENELHRFFNVTHIKDSWVAFVTIKG